MPSSGSFYDLAKAHIAAHGGEGVVLLGPRERGHQAGPWRAWMAYFAWLDGQTWPRDAKAATFGSLKQVTVPTEWPLDFDASAPPAPLPDPAPAYVSLERRKQLAAMLRAVAAEAAMFRPANERRMDEPPPPRPRTLDEIAEDYARNPPAVNTKEMATYLEQYIERNRPPPDNLDNCA